MSGIAEVEETGRFILVLKDFSLEPPHLSIEVRCLDRDEDPRLLDGLLMGLEGGTLSCHT